MASSVVDIASARRAQLYSRASSLPELLLAAEAMSDVDRLAGPAALIITDARLSPDTQREIERFAKAAGVDSVHDFLRPGRFHGLLGRFPRHERDLLVKIARDVLLPPASPPPAAPVDPLQDLPDVPPESARELRRWSAAHGVEDLLDLPEDAVPFLSQERPSYSYWLGAETVLQVITKSNGRRRPGSGRGAQRCLAAWRFLRGEADLVQRALEEERLAATQAQPVPDPVLQEFVARLEELRAKIRKHVWPRIVDERGDLSLVDEPPALDFEAPLFPWEEEHASVRLGLHGWRDQALAPECSCEQQSCRHALLMVDVVLRHVRADGMNERGKPLADLLRQPSWARVLRRLEQARVRMTPRETALDDTRLAWKLDVDEGDTRLIPLLRKPLKKGGYSTGSRVSWEELSRSAEAWTPADRRAIAALLPEGRPDLPPGGGMPRARVFRALFRLAGSHDVVCGRCGSQVTIRTAKLGMSAGPARGDAFTLGPSLGDEPVSFDQLRRLNMTHRAADLILRFQHETHLLTVVEADDEALELCRVFAETPVAFPAESYAELFQQAEALQDRLPIALPESVRGDEVAPEPVLIARLKPLPDAGLVVQILSRPLRNGTGYVPALGPREVLGTLEGRRVHLRREFEDEATRARDLAVRLSLRPETEGPEYTFTLENGDEALDLVARLQATTDPALAVEWPERPRWVSRPAQLQHVRMKVTQGKDWFGIQGEASIDENRIELAVLLDALRKRRRYVEVKEGMWVALSETLREKLTPLADQASGNDKGASLGLAGALAVEEIAGEVGDFEAVDGFSALLERIRTARRWEPEAPPGLDGVLRDYQLSGFKWMARLSSWGTGAVLADDMGLGKTIQALALLSHRGEGGPALVVAPTSVCGNWLREAQRFAPSLRPQLYRDVPGPQRKGLLQRLGPGDLVVTSYGLLVRDIERFAEIQLATLVLDESQAIKNADTLRAKAARTLQAEFKLALTGTPLENHLGELWSLYRVIFPGLFGSWDEFRDRYVRDGGEPEPEGLQKKNSPRAALARQIRPFLLRRTKSEVAPELPARTEMEEHIDLSPAERRLYEDARLAAVAKLTGTTSQVDEHQRFEVLAALTRLRLCASHPALYDADEKAPSSKLGRFLEIAGEIVEEGHRALVFSQFTKHLGLIREALDKREIPYLYLDGQTPPSRRDELVAAFQSGAVPLFLISLKAGGTGLNLTGADYVIHMDPWWNPAVEDQATDRAHRIGQTRPVTVVRLVARGTIEEQILSLHASKRTLVADVLAGSDAAGKVSTAELIDLIRQGATIAQADDDAEEGDSTSRSRAPPVIRSLPATSAPPLKKALPALPAAPPVSETASRAAEPSSINFPVRSFGTWFWLEGADAQQGLDQFKHWLTQYVAPSSSGVYAGTAKKIIVYARAAHAQGNWKESEGFDALAGQYLRTLEMAPVAVSRSQLALVRAVIARLRAFVTQG